MPTITLHGMTMGKLKISLESVDFEARRKLNSIAIAAARAQSTAPREYSATLSC